MIKKIYMIAGEPSGDFLGSDIIESIKKKSTNIELKIVGGRLMESYGFQSLFNIKEISVGGIIEVIPHIFKIKKLIKKTVQDILMFNPDIILTIDSPGFCFRVSKTIKKLEPHIKLVHLVAPSVWAWRPKRAKKISNLYDKLLTLFEFEPPYFTKYGLDTEFVGHQAAINFEPTDKLKDDILLIMPGSRTQEIKSLLPIFVEASKSMRQKKIVIPTLPHLVELIKSIAPNNFEIITDENEKKSLYKNSKLAIVASGTATLQLALSGCPMIVCYKLSNFTFKIVKMLIKTRFISLVNIISNKEIVPELIQNDCNSKKIEEIAKNLNPELQLQNFVHLKNKLLNNNISPSDRIAEIIINDIY